MHSFGGVFFMDLYFNLKFDLYENYHSNLGAFWGDWKLSLKNVA